MVSDFNDGNSGEAFVSRPELADYPHLAADFERYQRAQQILKAAELRQLPAEIPAGYTREDNIQSDPLSFMFVFYKTLQQRGYPVHFVLEAETASRNLAVYQRAAEGDVDIYDILDSLIAEDLERTDMLADPLNGILSDQWPLNPDCSTLSSTTAGRRWLDQSLPQRLFMSGLLCDYQDMPPAAMFLPGSQRTLRRNGK